MPSVRVRALVASAGLLALPFLALLGAGTAIAEGTAVAVASSSPAPLITLPAGTPSPSAKPTPSPTRSPTPRPTVSPTPRPTPTPRATYSPRPRVTATRVVPPAANPVTSSVAVGTVTPPTATASQVAAKPAATSAGTPNIGKLVALVVGAAVLLGLGGAAGLYVTRQHDD